MIDTAEMLDKLPEDVVYEILDRADVITRAKLAVVSKSCIAMALANWRNLDLSAQRTDATCHGAFQILRTQSRDSLRSLIIKSSFVRRENIIGGSVLRLYPLCTVGSSESQCRINQQILQHDHVWWASYAEMYIPYSWKDECLSSLSYGEAVLNSSLRGNMTCKRQQLMYTVQKSCCIPQGMPVLSFSDLAICRELKLLFIWQISWISRIWKDLCSGYQLKHRIE